MSLVPGGRLPYVRPASATLLVSSRGAASVHYSFSVVLCYLIFCVVEQSKLCRHSVEQSLSWPAAVSSELHLQLWTRQLWTCAVVDKIPPANVHTAASRSTTMTKHETMTEILNRCKIKRDGRGGRPTHESSVGLCELAKTKSESGDTLSCYKVGRAKQYVARLPLVLEDILEFPDVRNINNHSLCIGNVRKVVALNIWRNVVCFNW